MPLLLNKRSEIEAVQSMPNSEIEKYIQLAYKRESNRRILRERLLEGKTYREIIQKHYFYPVGNVRTEKEERVIRARINEIQKLETKFYRVVRRNRRAGDVAPVRHGRWIDCKPYNPEFNGYECSECGAKYQGFSPDNYCPNCGAKMDSEVNG